MTLSQNLKILRRTAKIATRLARVSLRQALEEDAPPGRFVSYQGFGANPGRLRMFAHVPRDVSGRPLVVLLHGCDQSAARFAAASGWIDAAERLQFPLVLPEQQDLNNARRCFRWFNPEDIARGQGEAASIAEMTAAAVTRFGSDPNQVFIVGLSAGAAMAASVLAAYPDLFAAGASVAGMPIGSAHGGMQALMRMASAAPGENPAVWDERYRRETGRGFTGPWPRLSIWRGLSDSTIDPENGLKLAAQWRALHRLSDDYSTHRTKYGALHQAWPARGKALVELWTLPDFPHAYPAGSAKSRTGNYVEPSRINATAEIIRFFRLD